MRNSCDISNVIMAIAGIDVARALWLPLYLRLPDIEHRFTLAVSARLMPVIASPMLAKTSANAGLIS